MTEAPSKSDIRTGLVLLAIGLVGMIIAVQVISGRTILPLPGMPSPRGLTLVGSVAVTPAVTSDGKVLQVTLHAVGEGVVGYAYVKGPSGDVKIDVGQYVKEGTQTISLRFPWRTGQTYTVTLYTQDMKKIGEGTVTAPFKEPYLNASAELSYGLVPSLAGTKLFIYSYTKFEALEVERLGALLVAGNSLSPPSDRTFIVVETGALALSKSNRNKFVGNVVSWIRAYGLYAESRSAALFGSAPAPPARLVLIFLDAIPYELRDSIPSMLNDGAVVIAVTPWLGKYWVKGGVLWVDPSPHPETSIVPGTAFSVFEDTTVTTRLSFLFYNETVHTRKVSAVSGELRGIGEIYLFRVGKGFVVWIPATCDDLPQADWLVTLLSVGGAWNLYWSVGGGGSFSYEVRDLGYDYSSSSLFLTAPIQSGTVDLVFVLMGSNGGYRSWHKTLYIPPILRGGGS